MTKELQDLAWSVLPKEFKEEVKEIYDSGIKMMDIRPSESQVYANKLSTLEGIFGYHNLTSDAEGEDEMLCVSRKRVQEVYDRYAHYVGFKLQPLLDLFGSKCLPGELTEDNFGKSEPKPAEPNPDGDKLSPEPQPANRTPSSYTQSVTDCHHTDRLHIAAMAMQALLSNPDYMQWRVATTAKPSLGNLSRIVARNALRYADALVAESHK